LRTQFIRSKDGTLIAYEVVGAGEEPVIFVDGALCFRDAGPMRELARAMPSNFRTYLYDRRGRGESRDSSTYDVQKEIEDIEALVSVAGGSAFLFGISSGAILALKAASVLTSRIHALALYEPPLVLEPAQRAEALVFTQTIDQAMTQGDRGAVVSAFLTRVMTALGQPEAVVGTMVGTPMWEGMVKLAHTIAYDNHVMGDSGIPAEAASLRVPSLVMGGGASPAPLQLAADRLAAAVPKGLLGILPGESHDVRPSALAPELVRFFEANR